MTVEACPLRVVAFLGRQHGLSVLRCLLTSRRIVVVSVFTHRRLLTTDNDEKPEYHQYLSLCTSHNVPLHHVDGINEARACTEILHSFSFDFLLCIDWERVVPKEHLALPMYCGINLHKGRLPNFKGANPLMQALMASVDTIDLSGHVLVQEVNAGRVIAVCRQDAGVVLQSPLKTPIDVINEHVERLHSELEPAFGPLALTCMDRFAVTYDHAIVFDMDGTLVDTIGGLVAAYKEFMTKHTCSPGSLDEFNHELNGPTIAQVVSLLKKKYDIVGDESELLTDYMALIKKHASTAPAVKGVVQALSLLKRWGFSMGVASSADRAHIVAALSRLGFIDFFTVIVSGQDIPLSKPAPDIYQRARSLMIEHSLNAAENIQYTEITTKTKFWAVEDSCNGVQAAAAAGMSVIHYVPSGTRDVMGGRNNGLSERVIPDFYSGMYRWVLEQAHGVSVITAPRHGAHVTIECIEHTPVLTDGQLATIDSIWDQALISNPKLFNGDVFAYIRHSVDANNGNVKISVFQTCYKYMLALSRDAHLNLGFHPIGVSGVVTDAVGTKCLLARRHEVNEYANFFETVPSGGLSVGSGGDYIKQLKEELCEETSLRDVDIAAAEFIGVTLDASSGVYDICARLRLREGMCLEDVEVDGLEYVSPQVLEMGQSLDIFTTENAVIPLSLLLLDLCKPEFTMI